MNIDELASKYGGTVVADELDDGQVDAIAAKYGGVVSDDDVESLASKYGGVIEGDEEPVQPILETAAYTVPQEFSGMGTRFVGGAARLLDKGTDIVAKYTGTKKGGLFADVAQGASDVEEEAARVYPTDERNPMTRTIVGGATQAAGLLGLGMAGKAVGMGDAAVATVPLVVGGVSGAGEGIKTAEEIGVASPEAQLALGMLFGGVEVATEKIGGIGGKKATQALLDRYKKPAADMLAEAAKTIAVEGFVEEPLAGSAQDLLTRAFATEDPENPGFTKTGVKLPAMDRAMLERRGMEALGGAAGGTIFAGVNALANAGKPVAPAGATTESGEPEPPDLSQEEADALAAELAAAGAPETAAAVAATMPAKRQPILGGVPDVEMPVVEPVAPTKRQPIIPPDVVQIIKASRVAEVSDAPDLAQVLQQFAADVILENEETEIEVPEQAAEAAPEPEIISPQPISPQPGAVVSSPETQTNAAAPDSSGTQLPGRSGVKETAPPSPAAPASGKVESVAPSLPEKENKGQTARSWGIKEGNFAIDPDEAEVTIDVSKPTPPKNTKKDLIVSGEGGKGGGMTLDETGKRDVTKPEQMTPDEFAGVYGDGFPGTKARDLGRSPKELEKRLRAALAFHDVVDRSGWKLDAARLQMVSPDGKKAIRFRIRDDPSQPTSYENQQTSIGAYRFVDPATPLAGVELGAKEDAQERHENRLENGIKQRLPVSVAAVDAYGIKLPEGYTKQGDLYVFKPEPPSPPTKPSSATTEAPSTPAKVKEATAQGPVLPEVVAASKLSLIERAKAVGYEFRPSQLKGIQEKNRMGMASLDKMLTRMEREKASASGKTPPQRGESRKAPIPKAAATPEQSPLQKQVASLKKQAGEALVAVRLGDFYEFFYDDAKVAAPTLKVALTKRNDVPMAGIPHHAAERYFKQLNDAGFDVAVADVPEGKTQREIVETRLSKQTTPPPPLPIKLQRRKGHLLLRRSLRPSPPHRVTFPLPRWLLLKG